MGNSNQRYESPEDESRFMNHLEQARVILLAPKASMKVNARIRELTNELQLVGIGVRMECLTFDSGKHIADGLGMRFVILISNNDKAENEVSLMDLEEHVELTMPWDQAIYMIEKVYPPANFT
jgi:histidyl-tRNA synthetase